MSLVACERDAVPPVFYGALLCKERFLEEGPLSGPGIEMVEYSSSGACDPLAFVSQLRKILMGAKDGEGNPRYRFLYARVWNPETAERLCQRYGFSRLEGDPTVLYHM